MKIRYKTTIVPLKGLKSVDAVPPDHYFKWELYSITVKKKKIFFHWTANHPASMTFSSNDDDYQKSLNIVKQSNSTESDSNVDNQ